MLNSGESFIEFEEILNDESDIKVVEKHNNEINFRDIIGNSSR